MRKGLIIMALGFYLVVSTEVCQTSNNGLSSAGASGFTSEINRLRNMVATGNQVNHHGKKETASNMNELQWSNSFATRAQNCAQKCPTSNDSCEQVDFNNSYNFQLASDFGFVTYRRSIQTASTPENPSQVLQTWLGDHKAGAQILLARESQFGCGRAIDTSSKTEYVVCFYDKKFTGQQAAYIGGQPSSNCQLGKSLKYAGLCAVTNQGSNLIHKQHSVKTAKGKKQSKHHHSHKQHHEKKEQWGNAHDGAFIEANQWFNQNDPQMELNPIDFM